MKVSLHQNGITRVLAARLMAGAVGCAGALPLLVAAGSSTHRCRHDHDIGVGG